MFNFMIVFSIKINIEISSEIRFVFKINLFFLDIKNLKTEMRDSHKLKTQKSENLISKIKIDENFSLNNIKKCDF